MSTNTPEHDAQMAAEIEPNVGADHVAAVYAEALLDAAEKAGRADALLDEFDSLVADVLDENPEFEQLLASALVSHDEKVGILDRVLGPQASPMLLNFLKIVSRRERLDCLRAIHRQARLLWDRRRDRVRVQVSTAAPVSEDLAVRIAGALGGLIDGQPVLERHVNAGLIGGLVVRVGDTVYDASVANRLKQLRQQIIDRSAHEIQSRRDRFRHPAGN